MTGTITVQEAGAMEEGDHDDGHGHGDEESDEMTSTITANVTASGGQMDENMMDDSMNGSMMDNMNGDGMMMDDSMMMEDDHSMMDDGEHAGHSDIAMMPEGEPAVTGMMSDNTMVKIWTGEPTAGEMLEISVVFEDSEHVNHDIMVTQNGEVVLNDEGAHHHTGMGVHMTAPLESDDPVNITVTFQGYGVDPNPKTGPIGETVEFTNVVPEFGTIAMMILAVAIISIIAVTAKTRVIPRI